MINIAPAYKSADILVKIYNNRVKNDKYSRIRWPPNLLRKYSGIVNTPKKEKIMKECNDYLKARLSIQAL